MAQDDDAGERTEDPSEKRREEFREKGDIARSKDAVSVLVLFAAIGYFLIFGDNLYRSMARFVVHFFGMRNLGDISSTGMMQLMRGTLVEMATLLAPLVAPLLVREYEDPVTQGAGL